MKYGENKKADNLYKVIGQISDDYVQVALMNRTPKPKRQISKRVLITLIAAVLVLTAVSSALIAKVANDRYNAKFDRLSKVMPQDETYLCETVPYFDGKYKLLWQYDGSDEVYCRNISLGQLSLITQKQQDAAKTDPDKEYESVKVWVCDDYGNVTSPFLSSTKGNTSLGQIFDYEPEFEVTEETADYLKTLFT